MSFFSSQLFISLIYVISLAIIVWLLIIKKPFRKLILLLLITIPLIYFAHWKALQHFQGWPVDEKLPQQFELVAADIIEPRKHKGIKGNIHLWIRLEGSQQPRSYRLPYSRELHQSLFETRQRIAQGKRQIGRISNETGSNSGGIAIGYGQKLRFEDDRRRQLPPK